MFKHSTKIIKFAPIMMVFFMLAIVAPAVSSLSNGSAWNGVMADVTQSTTGNTPGVTNESGDFTKKGFRFVVCDGPTRKNPPEGYIPCDFKALIAQVRKIINILFVAGVIAAFGTLVYAGYLFISGKEKNISKAKEMLPKMFWGFVLMLSAWFIVYQLMSWLAKDSYLTGILK